MRTIAMIGTGLIATRIASGRISPIAVPIDAFFQRPRGKASFGQDGRGWARLLCAEAWEKKRHGRYIGTMPALNVSEVEGRVRLNLGCLAQGEGASLQEAADDLICSILRLVMAFRSTGFRASGEFQPELETMSFLYELGEIAAAGGDIRSRVFA
jgi:hypothetical protein